jgi:hypothetical protein
MGEERPTGINEDEIHYGRVIDFEGRSARIAGLNTKMQIDAPYPTRLVLDVGDHYLVLIGYFRGGELMEEGRERHSK